MLNQNEPNKVDSPYGWDRVRVRGRVREKFNKPLNKMSSHAAVYVVQYNDMKIYIFTNEDPWVYLTRVHGSKIYQRLQWTKCKEQDFVENQ